LYQQPNHLLVIDHENARFRQLATGVWPFHEIEVLLQHPANPL
jgi:hypothetical protein